MEERVGEVKRTPFGALKKICEENSMGRIVGDLLPRYQKIINRTMEQRKDIDRKSMFTRDTKKALGIEILGALKSEDEMII